MNTIEQQEAILPEMYAHNTVYVSYDFSGMGDISYRNETRETSYSTRVTLLYPSKAFTSCAVATVFLSMIRDINGTSPKELHLKNLESPKNKQEKQEKGFRESVNEYIQTTNIRYTLNKVNYRIGEHSQTANYVPISFELYFGIKVLDFWDGGSDTKAE